MGYRWHGRSIGHHGGSERRALAAATNGPFAAFIFPTSGDAWRQPIRERVEQLAWQLGIAVVVAGLATLAAWCVYRRQARLAELESNFIASVSHELRTPVASIGALAERLESKKVQSPEEMERYHKFIAREGRRLAALINNVLDFSRIEQTRKHYEFEPVDYRRLVSETVALLRPYAEEKGLRLERKRTSYPRTLQLPKRTPSPSGSF